MKKNMKHKIIAIAAAAAANQIVNSNTKLINTILHVTVELEVNKSKKRKKPRLLRRCIPDPSTSVWRTIDEKGRDREFLFFTSLTRPSFNLLVELISSNLESHPIKAAYGKPKKKHLSRRLFSNRDIVAMLLKSMTTVAEPKDLYVQFGATATSFHDYVELGMRCIIQTLSDDPRAKVYWDRSEDALQKAAERTKSFLSIPNVVGMLDGMKKSSLSPKDPKDQNKDYNGWTGDTNRNVLLLWDPMGKIVDAVVNSPGSFHDSKAARWGEVYDHIGTLPPKYKVVCDSAFSCGGELGDRLVKTKLKTQLTDDNNNKMDDANDIVQYESQLTHLRQSSEWGNHVLVDTFRRLHRRLPTDNVSRGYILWTCILLCNYRTETMGRNQIRTYFDYLQSKIESDNEDENENANDNE